MPARCIEGPDIDTASFVDIDKRFHLEIARISQNPVCELICRLVIENMHRYFDRFLSMTRQEIRQNYQDLCDIKQAIASGRADDARRLASHHIDKFHQQMKTRE